MTFLRRGTRLAVAVLASLLVRVLARLTPQRWCPPAISLRLFRLSSAPATAMVAADVRAHLPVGDRTVRTNLVYAPGAPRGVLDLVLPDGPGPHPLVIWFHGGGWHFGDKADVLPYLEHLALRGFAGAAVNYPLAPKAAYPAGPDAATAALRHLVEHAAEYGVDAGRFVIAGDSAGAQLAAEVAASGVAPLRGALFFCGIFDPAGLDDSNRMFEAALESAMWSLSRTRHWKNSEVGQQMNAVNHLTADFPPTFLGSANADPLTRRQTPPMAARLRELGVSVDAYEAGSEDEPMYHQFQFRLGTSPGQEALDRASAFLAEVTRAR